MLGLQYSFSKSISFRALSGDLTQEYSSSAALCECNFVWTTVGGPHNWVFLIQRSTKPIHSPCHDFIQRFLLLCWSLCSCDAPSSLGDEWWCHRILHVESNFICNFMHPTLMSILSPSSKGDYGSCVLRADHISILSLRFRGGFASFHIVRQSFRLEYQLCQLFVASFPLLVSTFVSTCVNFASLEPLMFSGNILASLVSSPFAILMVVLSIAFAIASSTMSC